MFKSWISMIISAAWLVIDSINLLTQWGEVIMLLLFRRKYWDINILIAFHVKQMSCSEFLLFVSCGFSFFILLLHNPDKWVVELKGSACHNKEKVRSSLNQTGKFPPKLLCTWKWNLLEWNRYSVSFTLQRAGS